MCAYLKREIVLTSVVVIIQPALFINLCFVVCNSHKGVLSSLYSSCHLLSHAVFFHVITVVSVLKISLIIACIIGVIAYRLAVYAAFASIMKDSPTNNLQVVGPYITPQLATSVTASCINFVIIMILNLMYERVAVWITDMGEDQSDNMSLSLCIQTSVHIMKVL